MQTGPVVSQAVSGGYVVVASTVGAIAALLGAVFAGYAAWTRWPRLELRAYYDGRDDHPDRPYGVSLVLTQLRGRPLEIVEAGLLLPSGEKWRYDPWKPGESLGIGPYTLPRRLVEGSHIEQTIPLGTLRNWINREDALRELAKSPPVAFWVVDSRKKTFLAQLPEVDPAEWRGWLGAERSQ